MKKLPVLAAIKDTFASVLDNLGFAFRISWAWNLVLLFPMGYLSYILTTNSIDYGPPTTVSEDTFITIIIVGTLLVCTQITAFASIAVGWHRKILLNEVSVSKTSLRFDALVWRYILKTTILFFILLLDILIIGKIWSINQDYSIYPTGQNNILYLISLSPTFLIFIKFLSDLISYSMKLPAIALDRNNYQFFEAAYNKKQHDFRLFCFTLLLVLILIIPQFMLYAFQEKLTQNYGLDGFTVFFILDFAYSWCFMIIITSALTSLYSFFVEKRDF